MQRNEEGYAATLRRLFETPAAPEAVEDAADGDAPLGPTEVGTRGGDDHIWERYKTQDMLQEAQKEMAALRAALEQERATALEERRLALRDRDELATLRTQCQLVGLKREALQNEVNEWRRRGEKRQREQDDLRTEFERRRRTAVRCLDDVAQAMERCLAEHLPEPQSPQLMGSLIDLLDTLRCALDHHL